MSTLQETLDAITDPKLRRLVKRLLLAADEAGVVSVINLYQPEVAVAENRILTFGTEALLDFMAEDFTDAVAELNGDNDVCGDPECPNCGEGQSKRPDRMPPVSNIN